MNHYVVNRIKCLFFPQRCTLCGEVITPDERMCTACQTARRPKGKLCDKCGKPEEECQCDEQHFKCDYEQFAAPFYFEESVARGLIRFKNYGYTELTDGFADEMAKCTAERFESEFDCVTFVPMRAAKQRRRGYNQAELLAEAVAKKLDLPIETLLIKTHRTKSQRGSSARQRRQNLHGAFDLALDKECDGKRILLIDDIRTTGSTLSECALTLHAYGADSVYALAAAVAVDK